MILLKRQSNRIPFMASLIMNDPLVSNRLHTLRRPSSPSLPFENPSWPFLARVVVPKIDTCNGFRIDGVGGGGIGGLTLKGCFDSSSNSNSLFHKTRLGAANPLLALRNVEAGVEDEKDARSVNGRQWGSPLGFPNSTLAEKIVVAVDVDEVLGNFVSALNQFIADRYSLNHSVSEYHVYEFFKIWNCSRDEADIRVHEFFKTPYFKLGIHPIPGARRALHKLAKFCKFSVVTSRQNVIKDHTIGWIEKHYPGLFHEIHFGNHFALDGISRPKSEICSSLGAKVLIDDNPRYAVECANVGIRVLLFDYENSYPWCKTDSIDGHPLVTKVHNWGEVEQQLLSWIVS
ncbi:hypothetical protein SAY87_009604 [Trapa incisa]|uniref:Tac7077 n=1 Tax=Trapa incisa TaxID=236973 RepID=A0AAN7JZ09_9MYRT|nr:hypothetical protein SAY87_009604 [Trapa incisa]